MLSLSTFAQSWTELNSITSPLKIDLPIEAITTDQSGNVYIGGDFYDTTTNKHYVLKWDGNSWTRVGDLDAEYTIRTMVSDANGNLYAAGSFVNQDGYNYVAKWDGTTWSELGTGNNRLRVTDDITKIVVDNQNNVYAIGEFSNSNGFYVAKWNGTTWSTLGNRYFNDFILALTIDQNNNIYVGGFFENNTRTHYPIYKYDGTNWSEIGPSSSIIDGPINTLAIKSNGNVLAGGMFGNSNGNFVAEWDGTRWDEMGTGPNALNANSDINTLHIDQDGNVYAGGAFDLNNHTYISKWNGNTWTTVDSLPITNLQYSYVSQITSFGPIIYAIGELRNNNGYFVAQYVNPSTYVDSVKVTVQNNNPATINTNQGTLQMVASVFPATANQNVTWSIVPGTGNASISSTGLVTASQNGTVYAKATSVQNNNKSDSLLITISNQTTPVAGIDSVKVTVQNNNPATISTNQGTLQMVANIFPATANQAVNWLIVPGTGNATISSTGLVTASQNGTVYAKAISVQDNTKFDSLLITISNQGSNNNNSIDSVKVSVELNMAPEISANAGTLKLLANVFPNTASQDVTWSISPTNLASISNTGIVTAIANGTVWAKATSNADNSKADSIEITIKNQSVGILETNASNINVYPNPTTGKLNIEFNEKQENIYINIIDITGKIYNSQFLSNIENKETISIDNSNIPNGLYFLEIKSNNGNKIVSKFIKE